MKGGREQRGERSWRRKSRATDFLVTVGAVVVPCAPAGRSYRGKSPLTELLVTVEVVVLLCAPAGRSWRGKSPITQFLFTMGSPEKFEIFVKKKPLEVSNFPSAHLAIVRLRGPQRYFRCENPSGSRRRIGNRETRISPAGEGVRL